MRPVKCLRWRSPASAHFPHMGFEMDNTELSRSDRYRIELLGEKRSSVLSLDELHRVGEEFYEDPEGLRLYGMRPSDYYELGVRLAGRTAIECANDDRAVGQARA